MLSMSQTQRSRRSRYELNGDEVAVEVELLVVSGEEEVKLRAVDVEGDVKLLAVNQVGFATKVG